MSEKKLSRETLERVPAEVRERLERAEAVIAACQKAHRAGNSRGPCIYATKDDQLRPLAEAAFEALRNWR